MLNQREVRQRKDLLIGAAFTAWLQGAGEKQTFDQFLRHYGLFEKEKPINQKVKKAAIKKAKSVAERIIKMDKRQKKR